MLAPPTHRAAAAGALAAAAAIAATEVAAGLLPRARSVVVAVGDAAIALLPGPLVDAALAVLGGAGRAALLAGMAVVVGAIGGGIGVAAARRRWAGPLGLGAGAALGVAAVLTDPQGGVATALAPVAGAAVGLAALWGLLAAAAPGRAGPPMGDAPDRDRRRFLRLASAVGVAAAAGGLGGWELGRRSAARATRGAVELPVPADPLPPPPAGVDAEGVSPLLTPNDAFFRIDTALRAPRVDAAEHVVRVTGRVERELELSYADLLAEADVEADVALACVSNEVGGDLVGNARWLGVPLARLLDRAGVDDAADQVVGRSVDGWTGGFPVAAVRDGRPALVAVGMNGAPLPVDHGFPVRLVIAGLYGYVSDAKWLAEIELTTFDAYDAYWVQRGWAERGPIKTQSRIDVPGDGARLGAGEVAVAGVAWAGERGVRRVEVAVDGRWRQTELGPELAATSWRQWVLRWDAPPGEHELAVRATDGEGATQTAEASPPMPDGATGHHGIRVTVA